MLSRAAARAEGSELLSGQQALSTLSNNGLCATVLLALFCVLGAIECTIQRFDELEEFVGISWGEGADPR